MSPMNSININHFQFYTNSSRQYNKSNKIPNLFCDIRITFILKPNKINSRQKKITSLFYS